MSQEDECSLLLESDSEVCDDSDYIGIIEVIRNYTIEALEHLFLISVIYVVVCILLYIAIRWGVIGFNRPLVEPKRVMIFTAHPDDECMFFGPTILNLIKDSNCKVYITCFSTGANYGMGKVRKKELYNACKVLGLNEGSINIQSHSLLPDDIEKRWPAEVLAKMILHYVEVFEIDTIITFDKHGVSGHVNHCSLYYAMALLCIEHLLPSDCKIYTLESINVCRKYWSALDIPLCYLLSSYRYFLDETEVDKLKLAMREHKSQMMWYRKVYLCFSRYIFVNTLQEMDPLSIEFDLTVDD